MSKIIHVDMDAFYASVEERENPSLVGQPVVVGGDPARRGVVAAANYVSRQYGVRSAMPMSTALRKCPHLIICPPNSALYAQISEQIREIFRTYTPQIEPLSLDEAFLDPSGSERLFGDAVEIARLIKWDILNQTRLIASVGVAPNKFLAKLASDHEKPDGFTVIRSDQVQEFLDPLPVNRLWGVGKASTGTLNRYGIVTVRDLRCRDKSELTDLLGAHGDHLWDLSHGIDSRRVEADHEAKSISQESTFPTDIESTEIAEAHALALTEQVAARCRGAAVKARTLTLKIRFNDFTTVTRSRSTPHGSDSTQEFWNLIKGIIDDNLGSDGPPIRLLGVAASNFEALQSQVSLFDNHVDEKRQSSQSVDRLTDSIQDKFGRKSLKRGTTLLGRKQ